MFSDMTFLEKLRTAHDFPCEYTFKLIGDNTQALRDGAVAQVRAVFPELIPTVSIRQSSKARHQSITIDVLLPNAESVVLLYTRFRRLPGLKMML